MTITLRLPILLLAAFLALLPAAPAPAADGVDVSPTDAKVRLIGRWRTGDSAGPVVDWAGATVVCRFRGTGLTARLKTSGSDRLQVVVDGEPSDVLVLTKEPADYVAAKGLPDAEHTVELFKRNEPFHGTLQLLGLTLAPGGELLAAPEKPRKIEVVGDSITAGYGNLAGSEKEHFKLETEDNYTTYGAIAARALDAEYATVAVSGIRLTPSPKGTGEQMPDKYPRASMWDKSSRWDFARWRPDVIVINLGTNDGGGGMPDEAGWVAAYEKFLAFVREKNPQAQIFLASGPMMSRQGLERLRVYNRTAVDKLRAAGDARLHVVEFDAQRYEDGLGADYHPGAKTHLKMAERLERAIRDVMKW